MGDYARLARERGHLDARRIAGLLTIVKEGLIGANQEGVVLDALFSSEKSAREIVKEQGLEALRDSTELQGVVDGVLTANPDLVARFRSGESKLLGYFVGQVMRATAEKPTQKSLTSSLRRLYRDQNPWPYAHISRIFRSTGE